MSLDLAVLRCVKENLFFSKHIYNWFTVYQHFIVFTTKTVQVNTKRFLKLSVEALKLSVEALAASIWAVLPRHPTNPKIDKDVEHGWS